MGYKKLSMLAVKLITEIEHPHLTPIQKKALIEEIKKNLL